MIKQAEIIVSGEVQRVFFRAQTKNKAEELGLVGWVKNLPDGSVGILAQGQEPSLVELIEWCRGGAQFAKADKVEVKWNETNAEFKDFKIIY